MKKTAKEVVNSLPRMRPGYPSYVHESDVKQAMEEYKNEHTSPLIEALGEAKLQIEYLHKIFASTGSSNELLSKIRTLLNAK